MSLLLAALLSLSTAEVPEAREVFNQRQEDLILLSGKLGSLHRLSQVCPGSGPQDIYRARIMEVIEGEKPPTATREAMIENFNDSYRITARMHATCSAAAEDDLRFEANAALGITNRLSAPLGF